MPGLWSKIPIHIEALDPELLESDTESLLEIEETGSPELRVAAACALALRHDGRAYDGLVAGLSNPALRYPCLEALFHLADPRAREPVRRLFEKRFLGVFERTQAAGVLAALGDDTGRRHVLDRLRRRRRDDDRGLAIELASDLRLEEAVPALREISSNEKDLFRGAALKALATLTPTDIRPELERLVTDAGADPDVRADAAEALHSLGGADAELRTLAEDADPELAELARSLLGKR